MARCILPVALLVLHLGAHPVAASSPSAGDARVGLWAGELHHEGRTSTLGLRLLVGDDGGIVAQLSLPAIDVWDYTLSTAEWNGDTLLVAGMWALLYEDTPPTLTGTVPGALVPVHSIPVTLTPVDTIPRPAPPVESAPVAEALWTSGIGSPIWAGLAAADDRVYVGSDDGALRALDAGTGNPLWTFPTGAPIRSRPLVLDDRLLLHADDGFLYALDATTGEPLWKTRILEEARSRDEGAYAHYTSSPTVEDGVIHLGSADGAVHALDLGTGTILWSFATGGAVDGAPAVADGIVYAGSHDGSLYAIDAATGALRWSRDTAAAIVASPAVVDGLVVVGSRSYEVLAFDAATGERAWTYYVWFSWVESVVARGSRVYVGTSDAQQLLALDAASGEPVWVVDTGGSVWSDVAVSDGRVYAGSVGVPDYLVAHAGGFRAVDRNGGTVWRYPAPDPGTGERWGFASTPAVAGDRVFIGGLDGVVRAFPRIR